MATIKRYDLNGKEVGEEQIEDNYLQFDANAQMIKEYILAIRRNARQWSANTKVRKEVNHSNKKPHRQKGLGRARQGSLAAPHYRGGGRVFGPRPKFDQHVRINKKERRLAILFLLAEKIKGNRIYILNSDMLVDPKTKKASCFLKQLNLSGKRVLFLSNVNVNREKHTNLSRSIRNIQKLEVSPVHNVNGYDLAVCSNIVFLDYAVDKLKEMLARKK